MTDIEQKALALVNEIERERGEDELTPRIMRGLILDEALCRAIEQHEAFKQKVSDALYTYFGEDNVAGNGVLTPFFIPAPKPDPLVEVLEELYDGRAASRAESYAACLRAALEARGLEIRSKNDG